MAEQRAGVAAAGASDFSPRKLRIAFAALPGTMFGSFQRKLE